LVLCATESGCARESKLAAQLLGTCKRPRGANRLLRDSGGTHRTGIGSTHHTRTTRRDVVFFLVVGYSRFWPRRALHWFVMPIMKGAVSEFWDGRPCRRFRFCCDVFVQTHKGERSDSPRARGLQAHGKIFTHWKRKERKEEPKADAAPPMRERRQASGRCRQDGKLAGRMNRRYHWGEIQGTVLTIRRSPAGPLL